MEKKAKLGALLSGAGNAAKGLVDTAAQAMDQNGDGKFDLTDITAAAGSAGSAVKRGAQDLKSFTGEKARQTERKLLQPIFPDTLNSGDFLLPKFIRVTERDKKRAESAVCQGSIGYFSDHRELRLVNIFRDSVEAFGLTFYPDSDCTFYYADPSDRDHYIALDLYFEYLQTVRVNELERIAQDLGAKFFRVTSMEEKIEFAAEKRAMKVKNAGEGKTESKKKEFENRKIQSSTTLPGHDPIRPKLKYLLRDPNVNTLIEMRMNEPGPMHRSVEVKLSNSSGMKKEDAIKIDAVLKGMKFTGNASVVSEVQHESRRYFEYEIDF